MKEQLILPTNALQQFHTYFVGTLPRPYDHALFSETFMIDQGILEKTLEFAPREWLPFQLHSHRNRKCPNIHQSRQRRKGNGKTPKTNNKINRFN